MLDAKQKVQYKRGMANVLPIAKRVQILGMLCESMSMRAVSRLADVSINTVTKLLEDAGEACLWMHDDLVTLTNCYPDHEDIQGPVGFNVAQVITEFIPTHSTFPDTGVMADSYL